MHEVDYDDRQHSVYARGRALSPDGFAALDAAVAAEHTPKPIDGGGDLLTLG